MLNNKSKYNFGDVDDDDLEVIDASEDIDTYIYTPDNDVNNLINNAKFDYNRDFNENSNENIGKDLKTIKDNAIKKATKAWKEWKGENNDKITFYDLYDTTVEQQLKNMTGKDDAEKINKLYEVSPSAYRVINLADFIKKNTENNYNNLKLIIENIIDKEKKNTSNKAWNKTDDDFNKSIINNLKDDVDTLTLNIKASLSENNMKKLNKNYEDEVQELAKKEKEEKEYELSMKNIEDKRQNKRGKVVSPYFTEEEKKLMKQIEEERTEAKKENDESTANYETHKGKINSTKLHQENPRSDISTKTGDFEDIEEGEEDEFDKENNEILKYKHKKRRNTEDNTLTYETIPFKTITNTFERRFQTMPITEINRIMEQEINDDLTKFKVYDIKNDGIFEYQYMKTTNFECINIIEAKEDYGKKLLKNITGNRKDIPQIMEDFKNKIKNKIKNEELKIPKARIYLRYIGEDMGINVPYDDEPGDDFHWRAYSINPLNSQLNRELKYTEHPLFYVKMKKTGQNQYIFDERNSEVVSEKKYMEKLTSQLSQLSDSNAQSLTTFLGGLGMGIVLDSWDMFCKGLNKDSCELYSFCTLNNDNDKCELDKIDNTKNPYQDFNNVKGNEQLQIPTSEMLNTAWVKFKKCNTIENIKADDEAMDIDNIFNFYKDKNFNYDNYDILKGIIEEYKTKLKYISYDGYIKKYLEKIEKHISEPQVIKKVIEILNDIEDYKKISKNFEKTFKNKILNDFGKEVEDLFVENQTKLVANKFKNIFQLCNDNVLSNGINISNELEEFIKKTIRNKLSGEGESYQDYANQIAIIKTQLQNNIILWNYLDDSKLKTVKKLMKTLKNQTPSSDIYEKMDVALSKLENLSNNINSDHMKEYNKFINQYIRRVQEEIERIDQRLGILNSISKINTHTDKWKYIPDKEIKIKIGEEEKKKKERERRIKMLTKKKINDNDITKTIENEKEKRIEAEKEEFEKKKRAKTYQSIQNFKNSIQESKQNKKIIKKETQEFITNILNSIDRPTIKLSKDNEYIFDSENNDGDISNLLNEKITKQEANVISKKYTEAFEDELDDLNDYVVMDNMTETTFKRDGDKLKKVLKKDGSEENNPHLKDYKKDVEDIEKLLKVFQTKINNVKNGASTEDEKNLGRKLQKIYDEKEDEYKSKKKQMFNVIVPSAPIPLLKPIEKKKSKIKEIEKQNKDADAHMEKVNAQAKITEALLANSTDPPSNASKKKKKKKKRKREKKEVN